MHLHKFKSVICLLALMLTSSLQAAFIRGGSITYACLGNNTYKVTTKVNRACSGPGIDSFRMMVFNDLVSVPMSASRVSIKDISGTCSKITPPCNPNQTSGEGTEEHIYEATVDFNSSKFETFLLNKAGHCEVHFSFETSERDTAINTVSHGPFFIDAMLNLCLLENNACNSSPRERGFSPSNPVLYWYYDYRGRMEDSIDGDLLEFIMDTPQTAFDSVAQYNSGYSVKYPVTPFCGSLGKKDCPCSNPGPGYGICFNSSTGAFSYTPVLPQEKAVIVFRINEYRNLNGTVKLIGYTRKELVLLTRESKDNNPPGIAGIRSSSVCEGNSVYLQITTSDDRFLPKQVQADTVRLDWDKSLPGATFSIVDSSAREKEAVFTWIPEIGKARAEPYRFSVRVTDDFCPFPIVNVKEYSIIVRQRATDDRKYTKLYRGKLAFETLITSDTVNFDKNKYLFEYVLWDTTGSGIPLYKSSLIRDTFKFNYPGTYYMDHAINNSTVNCAKFYRDTLVITEQFLTDIPSISKAEINIMPNPSQGLFYIASTDVDLPGLPVSVYSMEGKIVYKGIIGHEPIDLSLLSKGMYLVQISQDDLNAYQRIIIN